LHPLPLLLLLLLQMSVIMRDYIFGSYAQNKRASYASMRFPQLKEKKS
jgi:hypothetical protein